MWGESTMKAMTVSAARGLAKRRRATLAENPPYSGLHIKPSSRDVQAMLLLDKEISRLGSLLVAYQAQLRGDPPKSPQLGLPL